MTVTPYIWIDGILGPLPDITFPTQYRDFDDVRRFGLNVSRPTSTLKALR
jgi:hypothetical protein